MSKQKKYFKDNKEMVDYHLKILNECYSDDDIDEDLQFLECDAGLTDENLEQHNHSSDSEMYASNDVSFENNTGEN